MGRKSHVAKREILPDPKFNDLVVAKFINTLMVSGKKSVAEGILYSCLDIIQEKTNDDPLKGFKKTCMTFFLIKTNFLRLEKSTF